MFVENLVCDYCGNTFICRHKQRMNNKRHFCCKKCEGAYRKEHNPNWIECPVCKKQYYIKPSRRTKLKHESCCSTQCMAEYRKVMYKGEKNPNWGNRGSDNPIWKSDKRISPYGYILVRNLDRPFSNCDGFVFEHRIIAEQYHLTEENSVQIDGKRYLSPDYCVHHIDGDKTNNNPENLAVMTKGEHTRMHFQQRRELASKNPEKSVKPKGVPMVIPRSH